MGFFISIRNRFIKKEKAMLTEWIMKMMNRFTPPASASLRKSPEMVKARTEADILKAEEDFKKRPRRPAPPSKKSKDR